MPEKELREGVVLLKMTESVSNMGIHIKKLYFLFPNLQQEFLENVFACGTQESDR